MPDFANPIPLTLYIHIPWCERKCPYCDFNSHARPSTSTLPEQAYVDALLADLEHDLPQVQNRLIESIFIGGGTPSLFSAQAIEQLLTSLQQHVKLQQNVEVTLEANPGSAEWQKFCDFRAAGINRLSIGVQSLNDSHLKQLGRVHDRSEAVAAIEAAHKAGFDNFNVDLMFGLPSQSVAQALADLKSVIALAPSHISHYQLTLEPNTLFHRYPPTLPDDETLWAIQTECQAELAAAGYQQYEISAYAKAGKRCQHNLNYWLFGDYLAIGAGAHGKLSDPATATIERLWKLKNPRDYLAQAASTGALGGRKAIPTDELPLEFMLNTLRLCDGFATPLFQQRTGLDLHSIDEVLHDAEQRKLLSLTDQHIKPTELGQRFLNDLLALFMPTMAAADHA